MKLNLDRVLAISALMISLGTGAVSVFHGNVVSSSISAEPTGTTTAPMLFDFSEATNNTPYMDFAEGDWDGLIRLGPDNDASPTWCNGLLDNNDSVAYCGTDGTAFLEIGDPNGGIGGVHALNGTSFQVTSGASAGANCGGESYMFVGNSVSVWSGTGAPTCGAEAGSLYLRSDGSTGSRLYVSAGGTTWNPISGV